MSRQTLGLTEGLTDYVRRVGVRETKELRALRAETAQHAYANMQIAPEQGQLLQLLAELLGARTCLEVGTFTGYSALALALVLPDDGRLVACDVSEEWTSVGQRYWTEAGQAHKIDLRLGPAADTLAALIAAGETGRFDFAFIDADKTNYDTYYERGLELLRAGGVMAVDNVLWGGSVIDLDNQAPDTRAIRAHNEKIADDVQVAGCPSKHLVNMCVKFSNPPLLRTIGPRNCFCAQKP